MVFVGPYEHHSNELPWRESIADVVVIGEDADGHIDLADLERQLVRYAGRPLRIGSFSAASNVTGILTDTERGRRAAARPRRAVVLGLRRRRAVRADPRSAESAPDAGDDKDAVFLSPHKFIGGPQTPGVLVVRRDLVRNPVPTVPGGGTVAFVDPVGHRYLDDPVAREEGGTPAIVESIRAGLVFALKQAVGTDLIAGPRGTAVAAGAAPLGGQPAASRSSATAGPARLSIVSFRIRHGAEYLHHNFVVAVLNDLFGIQARGGCSCAGPYGHRLLAIDAGPLARAPRARSATAATAIKPGWVRVNLNYFISDTVADYLIDAVDLIADRRLPAAARLPLRPAHRPVAPPPARRRDRRSRLADVRYGADGELHLPPPPRARRRGGPRRLPAPGPRRCWPRAPTSVDDGPTGLAADFEALRWFPLPPGCLSHVKLDVTSAG